MYALVVARRYEQFVICWPIPSLFPSFVYQLVLFFFVTVHNGDKVDWWQIDVQRRGLVARGNFTTITKKRPGHEFNYSSPSSPEVRMSGAVLLLPLYTFMAWTAADLVFT
jgi:hypothetical protein